MNRLRQSPAGLSVSTLPNFSHKLLMRNCFLLLMMACLPLLAQAQYPVVTIEDVQRPPLDSLQACDERSPLLDDTVTVRGVVVVDGGLAYSADGRNIWIQEGPGPWQGIDVRYGGNGATSPTDIWDLFAGDSVEITGVVERFGAETQINPLANGVTAITSGRPVGYTTVPIGDLNDGGLINQIETGEQWEGQYIEITDVTVVSVGQPFSGNRQNFVVEDADGNQIQVSDRFPAGRSVAATNTNNRNDDPGELVIPSVGTTFDTIRGLVFHIYPSGCAADGNLTFGYELHPFDSDDIAIGESGPQISGVSRNPLVPNETQNTTIQANIVDPDGNVASALLYYAVGLNSTNFIAVPMTDIGGVYQAEIPASAYNHGDYVEYYLTATDDAGLMSAFPAQGEDQPIYYAIRPNGATIYDVQFAKEDDNGVSPYQGQSVSVTGVVTASAQPGDLGYVYIQQPNQNRWAGLPLIQSSELNDLARGDSVRVTGQVVENFGLTAMEVNSVTDLGDGTVPNPVLVSPDSFTNRTYFAEALEGMLLVFANRDNSKIFVVDNNADDNFGSDNNFAEYRVGTSLLSDANGCRVLAGRQTNSAFSSLNVSYVNDSSWAANDGLISPSIPLCVVAPGDSMCSLAGIMTYSFGNFKLLPRNNDDFVSYSGENCPDPSEDVCVLPDTLSLVAVSVLDPVQGTLRAYPNPAQRHLTVEHELTRPQALQVELLDLMGRRLRSLRTVAGERRSELSLDGLNAGLYLLRVRAGDQVLLTEKIRVE